MAASNISYFIRSLNDKAKKEIEKGNKIFFTASAINENKSRKINDKEPVEGMSKQIYNLIKTEKPEIIKVDLFTENGQWVESNVCDLRPKIIAPEPQVFQGLGEAQVNALVAQRFEEMKKENDFKEMTDIVKELADENDALKARVNELEALNEELEESLESKRQVKYYAGILGDIMESVGIKKEKLRKPLAELMGLNDKNEKDEKDEKQPLPPKEDNSGIVEEKTTQSTTQNSTQEKEVEENTVQENTIQENTTDENSSTQDMSADELKRYEIITLISDYMNTVNNQLLGEFFTIFSEIESDKSLAPNIIEYIAKLKEFAS